RARGSYADDKDRQGPPGQRRRWEAENPPAQKFTKTDLAKYEHAWIGLPHFVCLGADKNFNKLAERIEEDGEPLVDVNYFQQLVAKAILFRSTEKIFTSLDLVGFRANSVAYAVALLSKRSNLRIDLNRIWAEQRITPLLVEALKAACIGAHQHISSAGGNPGEQSKKAEFWDAFRVSDLELPDAWEKEWAESPFVAPTCEEDALSAEWERVRLRLLSDTRTIQALEVYTNREWVSKYRRASVAALAAHDWNSLKRKPGVGLKKLRALVEIFAIAAADL
ncbi:MAG: AIPR family protein, partial [Pseudomonadota bacterium]